MCLATPLQQFKSSKLACIRCQDHVAQVRDDLERKDQLLLFLSKIIQLQNM